MECVKDGMLGAVGVERLYKMSSITHGDYNRLMDELESGLEKLGVPC